MSAARDVLIGGLVATLVSVGVWYAARRWGASQWRRWGWHLLTSCLPLIGVLLLGPLLPSLPGPAGDAWTAIVGWTVLGCAAIWAIVGVIEGLFALTSNGAPSAYRLLRGPRTAFLTIWVLLGVGALIEQLGLLPRGRSVWLALATTVWWCAVAPPAFVRNDARYRGWHDALGPQRLRWLLLILGLGCVAWALLGPRDDWFKR